VRGQRHAPAAPYPRERPGIHCTGGCVGLRAGLENLAPPGFDPRTGRQSLYRLCYPAHTLKMCSTYFCSTATVVTQISLNVTFLSVNCLSCS